MQFVALLDKSISIRPRQVIKLRVKYEWSGKGPQWFWLWKNCWSEQNFKYVFVIPTDYAMILKVFMVFKVVPLKRILSYQFVYKFLAWSL